MKVKPSDIIAKTCIGEEPAESPFAPRKKRAIWKGTIFVRLLQGDDLVEIHTTFAERKATLGHPKIKPRLIASGMSD